MSLAREEIDKEDFVLDRDLSKMQCSSHAILAQKKVRKKIYSKNIDIAV